MTADNRTSRKRKAPARTGASRKVSYHVVDKRTHLGDGEYVARGRSGEVLGRFDTAHEAIARVLKAAEATP
jgi:hypothetical protein